MATGVPTEPNGGDPMGETEPVHFTMGPRSGLGRVDVTIDYGTDENASPEGPHSSVCGYRTYMDGVDAKIVCHYGGAWRSQGRHDFVTEDGKTCFKWVAHTDDPGHGGILPR